MADKVRFGRAASDDPAGWARGRLRVNAARGALYGFGCGLPLTGRPALRRARWAVTGRRRFQSSTGCGSCSGPRVETSRYAAWWPSWLSAGLRSISLGVAVCPRREAELQKKRGVAIVRTSRGGGRSG